MQKLELEKTCEKFGDRVWLAIHRESNLVTDFFQSFFVFELNSVNPKFDSGWAGKSLFQPDPSQTRDSWDTGIMFLLYIVVL